ncbi:SusE outer membrane protein [Lutibacter agarilyticus]|uniref:SusE outer membrane protein n=1 Tax=Lutibacter agarilyticus TaxID=1109740 RepID=A0A238X344_9FLAO|nr:SusE domain-containing protein [Lutibacter agarilyticus]SNR53396.1 SusE outer membrane protein [Lutibacter agarilyticus]
MKKILNNILMLFSLTALIVSCDKEEFTVLNPDANTTASLNVSEVVLLPENADQDALIVSWTDPDFGYNAGASYQVTFTNEDQSNTISAGADLSKVFETVQLNKILLGIGVAGNTPTEVNVTINIVLSAYKQIVSNTTTFTATAYEDKLDLSTEWGVVGSAYNDWGNERPDAPFFTTSETNVLVCYVTLIDGMMKIRSNNSWDVNYGDTGLDGVLDLGGDDIPVTAGTYKITFNTSTLAYSIDPYSWGIVGDATPIGWPGDTTPPDEQLVYDSYSDTWKVIIKLSDGEIKFRANDAWDLNYGDTGADGILEPSGDNIAVTAGNYLITIDFKTLEYTLEEIPNIWGIVGDGTPIGWPDDNNPVPDDKLTIDFSTDDVWVLKAFPLSDGEVKFRANDSWDLNLGDTGADGVLEPGGDNIQVVEGIYDIAIDFTDPDAPTYTITAI